MCGCECGAEGWVLCSRESTNEVLNLNLFNILKTGFGQVEINRSYTEENQTNILSILRSYDT